MKLKDNAPISTAERAQLRSDARDVRATAERKMLTLDWYEEKQETAFATDQFELGCWLFYFSRRIGLEGPDGLKARIECAERLFMSGICNPGYDFFTVFNFGERQFDTIFEMGDAELVVDALRKLIPKDRTGRLAQAFEHFGWRLEQAKAA